MKRIAAALLCLMLVLSFAGPAFGADYTTEKYDVSVTVAEDNSYLITENVTINYPADKLIITRRIPSEKGIVSGVKINGGEAETKMDDGCIVAEIELRGQNSYVFSYRMDMYDDMDKASDSFNLPLIPSDWDNPVTEAAISISMPKAVDRETFDVSVYGDGAGTNDKLNVDISGSNIAVNAAGLSAYEGIKASAQLPEGYWVNPLNFDYIKYILIALLAVMPIAMCLFWMRFGRDRKLDIGEKPYPPEGIPAAEAGYIIDGIIDQKDITCLVMDFARKGYLRLEGYMLYKEKDISDDEPAYAKTVFRALFGESDEFNTMKPSSVLGLAYIHARKQIHNEYQGRHKRIFTRSSSILRVLGNVLTILGPSLAVLTAGVMKLRPEYYYVAAAVAVVLAFGTFLITRTFDKTYSMQGRARRKRYFAGILMILLSCSGAAYAVWDILGMGYCIAIFVSCIGTFVFTVLIRKHTKKSSEWYAQLLSLRAYIKVADYNRMKILTTENPDYFYDIMPYAYVFGLADKWAKNYAKVNREMAAYSDSMKKVCNNLANNILKQVPETEMKRADFTDFGGKGAVKKIF